MNCIIENKSKIPAYIQLYNQIKKAIVQGVYAFGSKLPSKRIMAAEAGVSTITIEHAYALLCEEGYVEARQRSGFFIIFRPSDGFSASFEKTGFLPNAP